MSLRGKRSKQFIFDTCGLIALSSPRAPHAHAHDFTGVQTHVFRRIRSLDRSNRGRHARAAPETSSDRWLSGKVTCSGCERVINSCTRPNEMFWHAGALVRAGVNENTHSDGAAEELLMRRGVGGPWVLIYEAPRPAWRERADTGGGARLPSRIAITAISQWFTIKRSRARTYNLDTAVSWRERLWTRRYRVSVARGDPRGSVARCERVIGVEVAFAPGLWGRARRAHADSNGWASTRCCWLERCS